MFKNIYYIKIKEFKFIFNEGSIFLFDLIRVEIQIKKSDHSDSGRGGGGGEIQKKKSVAD